jgi:hypothetical protein
MEQPWVHRGHNHWGHHQLRAGLHGAIYRLDLQSAQHYLVPVIYEYLHDHPMIPIDPSFLPFLDEAIARTGHERYRYLCLEYPDPEIRRQYQGLVIDIALGIHAGQRHDPGTTTQVIQPCCPGP